MLFDKSFLVLPTVEQKQQDKNLYIHDAKWDFQVSIEAIEISKLNLINTLIFVG